MLRPRSPVDAYRTDLAAAPSLTAFGEHDGVWLLLAQLLLHRAAALNAGDSEAVRAADRDVAVLLDTVLGTNQVTASVGPSDAEHVGPRVDLPSDVEMAADGRRRLYNLTPAVLRVADTVEELGALHLAFTILGALEASMQERPSRDRGLVLAQQARVARAAGALETAHDLYDVVARVGRASGDADLRVRSLLGQAVVARRRGNYPASRALYERALRLARRGGVHDLIGLAHHGLMIAAGAAGDVDAALQHGWRAFEKLAANQGLQADVLANLGAISSAAGQYRAALQAYTGAARRSDLLRVRVPALAGAALCAAHLGHTVSLQAVTGALETELARGALPYEQAQALALLAEAFAMFQPESAGEPYRGRALALAHAHGFHEFMLLDESAQRPRGHAVAGQGAAGAQQPTSTRRVLRALETLDAGEAPDLLAQHAGVR